MRQIAPRYEVDVTPILQGPVGNPPTPKGDETEKYLDLRNGATPGATYRIKKKASHGSNRRLVPKRAYAIGIEAERSRP